MEWSSGKNRMASALERLLHPKPKKKVSWLKYYVCCCCPCDKTDVIEYSQDSRNHLHE